MTPTAFRCSNLSQAFRERAVRWLTANSIDPNTVPLESVIVITGNRVTYQQVIHDRHPRGGHTLRIYRDRDGDWAIRRRTRTARIRYDLKDIK